MKVLRDNGSECRLRFGDNILITRNHDRGIQARNQPSGTPKADHIAYTIANWDTDKNVKGAVEAELKRRRVNVEEDEPCRENPRAGEEPRFLGGGPDRFPVQMGGKEQ